MRTVLVLYTQPVLETSWIWPLTCLGKFGAIHYSCNVTWRQRNLGEIAHDATEEGAGPLASEIWRHAEWRSERASLGSIYTAEKADPLHTQSMKSKQNESMCIHWGNGAWWWVKRKFIYLSFTERWAGLHRGGLDESNKQTWPNFIILTRECGQWVIAEGVSGVNWVLVADIWCIEQHYVPYVTEASLSSPRLYPLSSSPWWSRRLGF